MPDYQCFPIWDTTAGCIKNINPNDLPISSGLKSDLARWTEIYDATLNLDDPANSGFAHPEAECEFQRTGAELGVRLQNELGSDFIVKALI